MVLSGPLCMGQSRGDENEYRLRLDCEKAGRGDQSISNGLAGTVSESPCCNQRSRPGCDHSLLPLVSAPSAADPELFGCGGHVAVCCCERLGDQSSFCLMKIERTRLFPESLS